MDLVWFYSTSTIEGNLKPNPSLYILTILFQTIQFSINMQFKNKKQFFFKQFSLT